MHLLTVVNKQHPGLELWRQSALTVGLTPTILWAPSDSPLGHESKWFGLKFVTLDKHLETLDPDDLCLVTDGFDVVFLGNPEEDIRAMNAELLFAAELYENPDQGRPYSGNHRFKYLNSGVYAGKVKAIREALKGALENKNVLKLDDQRYFTDYYFSSGKITLDHEAKVFACLAGVDLFPGPKVLHYQGYWKDMRKLCEIRKDLCHLAMKIHRVPNWIKPIADKIAEIGSLSTPFFNGLYVILLILIIIKYACSRIF